MNHFDSGTRIYKYSPLQVYKFSDLQVYNTVYLTCMTITEAVLLLEPRTEEIQWSTEEEIVKHNI